MDIQAAYEAALTYLYERLPMFSRLGKAALKPNLDNITQLCNALGNPQDRFKSVHIAGTNGKGSTSHMLAAVLQKAGYKTGLHTSPHLVDMRERMRINGQPVNMEFVVSFLEKNKALIESMEPSFFEITVAMAFQAFAEEDVEIAVIETGLGGRLDSTNIITPILSIITNISYDHKDLLGNTLKEIAKEKAGIIKQGIPVLIGEQQDETEPVFFETAHQKQATVYYASAIWDLVRVKQDPKYQYFKAVHKAKREIQELQIDMLGTYQQHNIKTVLTAVDILSAQLDKTISFDTAASALSQVKKLTGLRGRWERLSETPLIIADVAHNPAGLTEVLKQWKDLQASNKHIVLGFVKDKDVDEALSLFPKDNLYYFCNADIPRALASRDLQEAANAKGLKGIAYASVKEAMQQAMQNMQAGDALLVTGSFFIVGEGLECLGPVA